MELLIMKKFREFIFESATGCPLATHDLSLNLKNRQAAIDEYGYGPMNPMEPSKDFWDKKAKMWKVTPEYAKTARCENCAAFNISDAMRECIENGIKEPQDTGSMATIEKADLGYCTILHFKCAGTRTCDVWLTNGPLDNKDL